MKCKYSVLIVAIIFSCNPEYDIETVSFNEILKNFKQEIPISAHVFILIPTYSCYGCVQKALTKFDELLTIKDKNRFTVIYQQSDINLNSIKEKITVLFDEQNSLNNLPVRLGNMTLILTKNNNIIDIITVQIDTYEDIINSDLLNFLDK
ncbi:MAG: hypothetical protein JXA03_15115 [Bacteroidales bacterium]|nr:hypothetical protein [Bacteroidales bacterium]